jgi:predicted dehydrogenase
MSNSTNRDVSAGVIGVGSMGRHHARVYSELADVELVGVFDVDPERAGTVAAEYRTKSMGKTELLETVDVASVAVPTHHHYEIARECIDHGVDVLVEKPFMERPERGRELVSSANNAGVTVQVGHIERFNPAVRALEDVIDDLDIIAIEAERLGPPPDRNIDDSAVLDLMIHDIDLLLWLVDDDIATVTAVGSSNERYATANVQFEGGVVGRLTASRVTQRRTRKLVITAASRVVVVDYTDQSIQIHRHSLPDYVEEDGDVSYRHESVIERPIVDNREPLKAELESFVERATSNEEPVVSGEDGLRALEVALLVEDLVRDDPPVTREGDPLVEVDTP